MTTFQSPISMGERTLPGVNRDEETLLIYGWESELRKVWSR